MAQCVLSAQEFIQNAFSPVIAVLTTPKVETTCQKNNLSFVDLVQPFCKLNAEVHLRDPTNQTYPIRSLRLNLTDMNYEPPKQLEARRMLYDVVASTLFSTLDRTRTMETDNYSLQINNSTPWFEVYREWYLKVMPTSEHEFTGNFLAFIMVVSADDNEAMVEYARMSQEQHNQQYQTTAGKMNRWFLTNPLKYYVLVQDVVEHDQAKTESLFQNLKTTYGANACHLLRINSRDLQSATISFQDPQSNLPDPWSQFLARRPTIGPENGEANITTPSPVEEQDIDTLSQDMTNSAYVDHPLMSHHFQKHSLSNIAIELEDEPDSSVSATQSTDNNLANMTLNPESIISSTDQGASAGGYKNANTLPHGVCLTSDDTDRIRLFIQEFSMRALLPFIEKQMAILHEQVTNRKGLHRSFFSATKKWFGGNKPGPAVGNKTSFSSVVYSSDSVELQVRHLGDLAFMFQHYELAYQAYHSIKRDFNSDQAWLHYSGALEMAALSVFMQGVLSQRQVPFHYFDTAINTYLNTCKSATFATRATFLATECFKHCERYLEAANYFVRLTSEDSDLRSGLLLEQASYCHLNASTVNIRKYAFYIILAGHRFNKAGQKKHALRCYKQALQVYQGKQWMLAEDHINLITGRLNFNLNHLEEAISSFYKLLYDGSLQGINQQMYYLREYLAICSHWLKQSDKGCSLPQLPIPIINAQESVLVLGEVGQVAESDDDFEADYETSEQLWYQLEEAAIVRATGSLPITHRPMLQRYTSATNNSKSPLAVVNEPITLLLPIRNPLNIPLMVTNVHLTWTFKDSDSQVEIHSFQSGSSEVVDTKSVPEVAFSGNQVLTIRLSVVPLKTGQLRLQGIAFNLKIQNGLQLNLDGGAPSATYTQEGEIDSDSFVTVRGTQPLTIKGARLNTTQEERCGVVYSKDLRLEPDVVPVMPKLMVKCENFQKALFCGQVCSNVFKLTNCGNAPVKRIFLATTTPHLLTFGRLSTKPLHSLTDPYHYSSHLVTSAVECQNGVFEIPLPDDMPTLSSGGELWLPFWVQGPEKAGSHSLNLLMYYEPPLNSTMETQRPRCRTLRLSSKLETTETVNACAIAITGPQPSGQQLHQNVTVAVEISNINNVKTNDQPKMVKILQISCASRRWSIEPLDSPNSKDFLINSKESFKWCFRAVEQHLGNDNESVINFSNINLQSSEQIDSSKCPCVYFYNAAALKLKSKELMDKKELPELQDNNFTLCLMLLWQCYDESKSDVAYGQHHIIIDKLNTMYLASSIDKCEDKSLVPFVESPPPVSEEKLCNHLRYYLFSPRDVMHDFSLSRACIVPVYLVFYNDTGFEVETEVDANRLLMDSIPTPKRETCKFAWIGCCRTTIRIQFQETKVVRLQGCFFHHGTYSLNAIGIVAKAVSDSNKSAQIKVSGNAQLQMIWDSSRNLYRSNCL